MQFGLLPKLGLKPKAWIWFKQEKVDEDLVEPEPGPLRDPSILKLSLKMDTDPSPLENWIDLVIAEPAFSLCQLCLKREIYDPLITIKEKSEI